MGITLEKRPFNKQVKQDLYFSESLADAVIPALYEVYQKRYKQCKAEFDKMAGANGQKQNYECIYTNR